MPFSALLQSTLCVFSTWSPKSFAVLLVRRAASVVAVPLAVVAGEAVLGVGVLRTGAGGAGAVLRQVAVPCLGPTDAACRSQLRETQMVVRRLSEERTLAHQQARRHSQTLSGPRGNAISISGSSRVSDGDAVDVTYLAVVAALAVCTLGSCSESAVGGVAAGIGAFLADRAHTGDPQHWLICILRCFQSFVLRGSNLHAATVALLPGFQEGISAHRSPVNAICRGGVQQTGRVDLLQEPIELLLAAATEQLRVHHAERGCREQEDRVNQLGNGLRGMETH